MSLNRDLRSGHGPLSPSPYILAIDQSRLPYQGRAVGGKSSGTNVALGQAQSLDQLQLRRPQTQATVLGDQTPIPGQVWSKDSRTPATVAMRCESCPRGISRTFQGRSEWASACRVSVTVQLSSVSSKPHRILIKGWQES